MNQAGDSVRRSPCMLVGFAALWGLFAATMIQAQQPSGKRLTVACYWQNYEEWILSHVPNYRSSDVCAKYKDPTHCNRTAPDMLGDAIHGRRDWEKVTANGLIYTITCKKNCKKLPVATQSYDAETDEKWMWITFESPDNKNLVEIFEIFDISPMKEENAAPAQSSESTNERPTIKVGTGFFVSEGYTLTNAHVVSNCTQIQIAGGRLATLVNKDDEVDLAVLKIGGESPAIATFRVRPAPQVGDGVIAFGFPLQGLLSSEGNLSTGTVAALAGLGDDPRFIQITAPIQPGNSGSPLLDSGGDVIGVVESKLDALKTLQLAGDIPQAVNFAIRASETVQFLERSHVPYRSEATDSVPNLKVTDVAARARQFSVPIECTE
jgi:S1-C subfamily serine protease